MQNKTVVDKALDFGAGFDWITPVVVFVMRAAGQWTGMSCPLYNSKAVRSLLAQKGLKMYAAQVGGDRFYFDVPARQVGLYRAVLQGLVY